MWLQSIKKIQMPRWLRENARQLRTTVTVFAVLVCINALLYAFFIVPSLSRLKTGETKIAEFRHRHAVAVLFKKQKPVFAGLMEGIPTQKDIPLLVKKLVLTARRLNLSVAAIDSDFPKSESGGLAMLSFSFPVKGRYSNIKRFIYKLETTKWLIGMRNLKLESDKGRVKLQMKLITYVRGR
jgi:Tfp pilus assembly protein PilO